MPSERLRLTAELARRLTEERRDAADRKFEDFDFGATQVEDAEGWEYENEGQEMTRTIYFVNSEDPGGASQRGHFTVRFEAGASTIAEAYGVLGDHTFDDKPEVPAGPRP